MRPTVGLMPASIVRLAGFRIDPDVSVPTLAAQKLAAVPMPELDPPGGSTGRPPAPGRGSGLGSYGLKAKPVSEFIHYARAKPGKVNYATGNTTGIVSTAFFASQAGIQMVHVPYKGEPQAITDLLAGRVQLLFASSSTSVPQVRDGKLRALATTLARRSNLLPDVPTVEEAGLKGYDVSVWYGAFTTAGTPPDVIKKLNESINASLRTPEMLRRLTDIGAEPAGGSPEALRTFVQQDTQKWASVIKAANIRFD